MSKVSVSTNAIVRNIPFDWDNFEVVFSKNVKAKEGLWFIKYCLCSVTLVLDISHTASKLAQKQIVREHHFLLDILLIIKVRSGQNLCLTDGLKRVHLFFFSRTTQQLFVSSVCVGKCKNKNVMWPILKFQRWVRDNYSLFSFYSWYKSYQMVQTNVKYNLSLPTSLAYGHTAMISEC